MTALQYGKGLASTTLLMHADVFLHCSLMADLYQVALHLLKMGETLLWMCPFGLTSWANELHVKCVIALMQVLCSDPDLGVAY